MKKIYIYKKKWGGIQETEDLSKVINYEYRISVDKDDFEEMEVKLIKLQEELNVKNPLLREKFFEINDLNKKINDFEEEQKIAKKKINDYQAEIKKMSILMEEVISKEKKVNSIGSGFDVEKYIKEIEALKLENNLLTSNLEYLEGEIIKSEPSSKKDKKINDLGEVIERKQKNIRKLKLELEQVRNKKNRTNLKDVTLDLEGDSLYLSYQSKEYISNKREKTQHWVLPFDDVISLEEVEKYIESKALRTINTKLYELIKEGKKAKIQTKNGSWEVVIKSK